MAPTIALIVAAGESSRFAVSDESAASLPKPYCMLENKPLLRRAIETFLSHPGIDGVRVVIRRKDHPLYKKATQQLPNLFPPVIGGSTRQASVLKGLESIARVHPEYVLIHDAARPLISHAVIDRVLASLRNHQAVLPAIAIADTLRRAQNGTFNIIDRTNVIAAQTPQGFHFDAILQAHHAYRDEIFTDDIALAEKKGLTIGSVNGDRLNHKVTTQADMHYLEECLHIRHKITVGMGFDTHAFINHPPKTDTTRKTIRVCGIKIPHPQKLKGHSDADVGLHALVDALLGSIGAGDIGMHFPDDDPTWAAANSSRFLMHAYELVKEREGDIQNIDLTIIGEAPRISPYRTEMVHYIADLLKLAPHQINIKATTTEKMGFLGRSEGLAAQAVVSVRIPAT